MASKHDFGSMGTWRQKDYLYSSKNKLADPDHSLAMEIMKTDSGITTQFEGIESPLVFSVIVSQAEVDEATGDKIWKDVKSLCALLHGTTLPQKAGAGVTREAKVLANESC
jgi:hypothetical protein